MENALFSLENSTIKINGHTILSEISLSIEKGEKITLVGQSGAGKSTLANALLIKFLEEGNRPVTLLDGELVSQHLSIVLGF